MNNIFLNVINISITASWIVFAVILLRVVLKKTPKWVNCILWGIVGLRLLIPINIQSALSLIPSAHTIDTQTYSARPNIQTGINLIDERANAYFGSNYFEGVTVPANNFNNIMHLLAYIWILGIIIMLIYAIFSYIALKRRVSASLIYDKKTYFCDDIKTPFILGVINPKIYLPSGLSGTQINDILKHETAHLKRGDHIWKPIGFLILTFYWFNPILWIAYVLLCRDIELACDEKAIRNMDKDGLKRYSETLLECSIHRRMIMACPVAFGEVGVKQRVKSLLNYKKPAFWLVIGAIVLCIVFAICFLTNPKGIKITSLEDKADYSRIFDDTDVLTLFCENEGYENESEEVKKQIFEILREVRINKNPLSQNRSEDRNNTNRVVLSDCTLNFNEKFTQLWISNGVKPSLSYKVLTPEKVKKAFDIMIKSMVKEKNIYQKAADDGVPVSEVDIEGNFKYTDVSGETNSVHTTPYGTVVERFLDPKTEIYCKMLNTVDYFNRAQITFETSMYGNDVATIYCNTDIDGGNAYEVVRQNGNIIKEIYSFNDKIIDIDHTQKSLIEEYFPTYKRSEAPYIPLEKRVIVQEDGIPGCLYRKDLTHCSMSSFSLYPQGIAFSYLMDFDRWEIVESNKKFLSRNCIEISGNPTPYSGEKHNNDSFKMLVDSETGVLLMFEGIKEGNVTNYIIAKEFSLGEYRFVKKYDVSEYSEYNLASKVIR